MLRYEEVGRLLKHPKLRQGSAQWPAHNGVTEGPLARWFASWILNKEGEEHHRLRRLMNPAFSPKLIGGPRSPLPGAGERASSTASPSPTAASS